MDARTPTWSTDGRRRQFLLGDSGMLLSLCAVVSWLACCSLLGPLLRSFYGKGLRFWGF